MNVRRLLQLQADRIETTLSQHRAPGRVTGGTVTPRWVRFDVLPEPGVRVDAIKARAEDLARALDMPSVRVNRKGSTVSVETVPDQVPAMSPFGEPGEPEQPGKASKTGSQDRGTRMGRPPRARHGRASLQ